MLLKTDRRNRVLRWRTRAWGAKVNVVFIDDTELSGVSAFVGFANKGSNMQVMTGSLASRYRRQGIELILDNVA